MQYTNPNFDLVTVEEAAMQRELLRPLREKHMRQMLDSGLAARAMNVPAIFNQKRDRTALTEGSLLTPIRTHLWNLQPDHLKQVRYDVGFPSASGRDPSPDTVDQVFRSPVDNYLLHVRRRESMGRAAVLSTYAAGVLLDYDSSSRLRLADARLPFFGVTREDMTLLAVQLEEISAFADDHDLTIIDRTTLMEGRGELVAS